MLRARLQQRQLRELLRQGLEQEQKLRAPLQLPELLLQTPAKEMLLPLLQLLLLQRPPPASTAKARARSAAATSDPAAKPLAWLDSGRRSKSRSACKIPKPTLPEGS